MRWINDTLIVSKKRDGFSLVCSSICILAFKKDNTNPVHIPLATLAAILFVVAWNMSEAKYFIKMVYRTPRAGVAILLITFILTVFADLVVAVNVGVILAILHFLQRMATSVEVRRATEQELTEELLQNGLLNLPPEVFSYFTKK